MGISWGKYVADRDLQTRLPPSSLSEGSIVKAGAGRAGPRIMTTTLGCCTTCTKTQPFSGNPVTVPQTHEGLGYPRWLLPALHLPHCSQED